MLEVISQTCRKKDITVVSLIRRLPGTCYLLLKPIKDYLINHKCPHINKSRLISGVHHGNLNIWIFTAWVLSLHLSTRAKIKWEQPLCFGHNEYADFLAQRGALQKRWWSLEKFSNKTNGRVLKGSGQVRASVKCSIEFDRISSPFKYLLPEHSFNIFLLTNKHPLSFNLKKQYIIVRFKLPSSFKHDLPPISQKCNQHREGQGIRLACALLPLVVFWLTDCSVNFKWGNATKRSVQLFLRFTRDALKMIRNWPTARKGESANL